MAINFRIQRHKRNNELHISLIGDFDGSSAMELLHALHAHAGNALKIYIHTGFISSMAPFGEEVFKKRFSFLWKSDNILVFTGRYRNRMVPEACN